MGKIGLGLALNHRFKSPDWISASSFIYEDRVSEEDFINALTKMYEMSKEDRDKLGMAGRDHVIKNYSFDKYQKGWVSIMDDVYNRMDLGSKERNYTAWELISIN